MLHMISIFLNLLRFDLWPKMWSVLENVPCPLEKKVYSSAFGWNVLKISMSSISSKVSFKTCVSLLIFCFDDLSICVSGVLKSPTIIVLLSISPFLSVSVCLLCWGAPMLGVYLLKEPNFSFINRYYNIYFYVFLLDWSLDHYVVSFLISCNTFYFKIYFLWYEDCYSSILLISIWVEYIFPSSHLQYICVFRFEVGFL